MADPRYEELMMRQARSDEPVDGAVDPEMEMAALESAEEAGRGGDAVLGHLTPGEIVIPVEIAANEEVMEELSMLFESAGVDLGQYTVGSEANSINPETGYPEFGWLGDTWDKFTGKDKKKRAEKKAKTAATKQARQMQAALDKQMAQYKSLMDEQQANFAVSLENASAEMKAQQEIYAERIAEQQKQSARRIAALRKEAARKEAENKRKARRAGILNQRSAKAGIGAREAALAATSGEGGVVGGAGVRSLAPTTRPKMRRASVISVPKFSRRRTASAMRRPK